MDLLRQIALVISSCRVHTWSYCSYLGQEVVHSKGLCMVAEHLEGIAFC